MESERDQLSFDLCPCDHDSRQIDPSGISHVLDQLSGAEMMVVDPVVRGGGKRSDRAPVA